MRFLGLVVSQWGLFHLPENTFLKKSVAKVLQKRLFKKCQVPKGTEILGFSAHLNQRELLPLDFLFFIQGVFHLFTVILFRTFHSFSCGNFVYVSFCTQIVLRNNAYSNVNISFRKFFTYGYFLSHCSRSSIIALSPGILNIPARPFLISFVAFFADTNDILCPSS